MDNLILIGYMGSGKSTIGKILARNLNYLFIDTDNCIEKYTKLSINNIFKIYGENYFRNLENFLIEKFLKKK